MINREKSQLKNLLSCYGDFLQDLARQQKIKWKANPVKKRTQFETIYTLGKIDGQCSGLDEFLRHLEDLAHD